MRIYIYTGIVIHIHYSLDPHGNLDDSSSEVAITVIIVVTVLDFSGEEIKTQELRMSPHNGNEYEKECTYG